MGRAGVGIRQRAEQRSEAPRRARPAPAPRRGQLTPQALLALQRSAGNASVARLMEENATADIDLEVTFPLDADGDGKAETKRLFIEGEGEEAELYINPEPMVFQKFLQNNKAANTPAVSAIVKRVRELMKKPITAVRGLEIEGLLERLAGEMRRSFNVEVPPSTVHTWKTKWIQFKTLTEHVTDHLVVEPLSARPGPGLSGSGVQRAKTDYMKELHNWSGYVRGHMLNAKLHGPGTDENLVPISGTFNADMKNNVEEYLKDLVSSQNLVVSYEIRPIGWGAYAGTKRGKNIETTLPDRFEMHVRPMRLRQPGLDGSIAANWVRSGQDDRVFTQNHSLPGSQRFDESAEPKILSPGVYHPDDLQALWKNPTQTDVWVYQGRLNGHRFSGEPFAQKEFKAPTNLAGEDATGTRVPIVQHDDALFVTSAASAKAHLDAVDHAQALKLGNLKRRLDETAALLTKASENQQTIETALKEWEKQSTQRAAALQQRGLDLDSYDRASRLARERILGGNEHRKARLGALGLAHADHDKERLRIAAAWQQHTDAGRALLALDEQRFYLEQAQREAKWDELKAAGTGVTQPNNEAIQELKELVRLQGFVQGNVYGAEADEIKESQAQLAAWEREDQARRAREEEQARRSGPARFDIDFSQIDIDIDIDVPEPLPSPVFSPPHAPTSPRGRPPKRANEPPGYRRLVEELKAMMKRGRGKLDDRESIAEFDAWAARYIKVVAREAAKKRKIGDDLRRELLRGAYLARNDKLERLGVEVV